MDGSMSQLSKYFTWQANLTKYLVLQLMNDQLHIFKFARSSDVTESLVNSGHKPLSHSQVT